MLASATPRVLTLNLRGHLCETPADLTGTVYAWPTWRCYCSQRSALPS